MFNYSPRSATIALCFSGALLSHCSPADPGMSSTDGVQPDAVDCTAAAGITPICGFLNPEDLAVIPGGEFLLVSEMGAFMSDQPNTLSMLDIASAARAPLDIEWAEPAERWGDPDCAAPDAAKFSPHGIDLITRPDGLHQLLVVNHGDEQVEFFELLASGADSRVAWRGCARPGMDAYMNDVAGLADGGFFVTHMWNKSTPFDTIVAQLTAGEKIGWVWEWQRETGFTKLAGSDEMMPNGIAVSADNSALFVNIYMANKTIKVDRGSGAVLGEVAVRSPDNVVIDGEGFLWIASHLNDPVNERCEDGHAGPCLLEFQVVKANSADMSSEVVLRHDGQPMGYATVALPHAGRLYLGSASGDRVAWVEVD